MGLQMKILFYNEIIRSQDIVLKGKKNSEEVLKVENSLEYNNNSINHDIEELKSDNELNKNIKNNDNQ